MAEIGDLNPVDDSNVERWPEGMPLGDVNNAGRALEGLLARWHRDWNGSLITAGDASNYTIAATRQITAYYDGLTICATMHVTNAVSPALNVDSVGANFMVWPDGQGILAGELPAGAKVTWQYEAANTRWQVTSVAKKPFAAPVTTADLADGAVTTPKIADNAVDGNKIDLAGNVKGSLAVHDGTNWKHLGVGPDGNLPTADSSDPLGIKWEAPSLRAFVGTPVTLAFNTSFSFAHGFAIEPIYAGAVIECVTADRGYSPGDKVFLGTESGSGSSLGVAVEVTTANVIINIATGGFGLVNKGGGTALAPTAANWTIRGVAIG